MKTYVEKITDVAAAAAFIAEGRVVAVPTGTSYGLAADALQGWAVQRVRVLKQRPADKALTVFMADSLLDEFLDLADNERSLLQLMQNRALTVLVKPRPSLAHLAQDGLVGLRVIDHPLMRAVAVAANVPLTATSANRSGAAACFTADCIADAFPGLLPDELLQEGDTPRGASGTTYDLSLAGLLDGGELPDNPPTTIAKIDGDTITIVRQGALSREALQQALV